MIIQFRVNTHHAEKYFSVYCAFLQKVIDVFDEFVKRRSVYIMNLWIRPYHQASPGVSDV